MKRVYYISPSTPTKKTWIHGIQKCIEFSALGTFIEEYLLAEQVCADHDELNVTEQALGIMACWVFDIAAVESQLGINDAIGSYSSDAPCQNRDVNPKHTWLQNPFMNDAHSICSAFPEIPCHGQCICHHKYKCQACFFKLTQQRIFDIAAVESRLGINGTFEERDFFKACQRLVEEWQTIFEGGNQDVPDFFNTLTMANESKEYILYTCDNCGADFITDHEACAHIRICDVEQTEEEEEEDQEVLPLTTDSLRPAVIGQNVEYLKAILDVMLEWGGATSNWTLLASEVSHAFSVTNKNLRMVVVDNQPFRNFCERHEITVAADDENCLLCCEGFQYGCRCSLHNKPTSWH